MKQNKINFEDYVSSQATCSLVDFAEALSNLVVKALSKRSYRGPLQLAPVNDSSFNLFNPIDKPDLNQTINLLQSLEEINENFEYIIYVSHTNNPITFTRDGNSITFETY